MTPGRPGPRPYSDPYLAGIGLGLVLLVAFVTAGRGLGASGAFGRVAAETVATVAPEHAETRAPVVGYRAGGGVMDDWVVLEILGVLVGGALSAALAGRLRPGTIGKGEGIGAARRLRWAAGGGALMGFGAMLARGCTSGLALTGGAQLSVGAWIFLATAFGAGYLAAPFAKGLWT